MLSLASNPNCLLMDDELNVLPTSSHVKSIAPVPLGEDGRPDVPGSGAEATAELKDLRESLADTQVRTLSQCISCLSAVTKLVVCPGWSCWLDNPGSVAQPAAGPARTHGSHVSSTVFCKTCC